MSDSPVSLRQLILVPALITLGVTLLRLIGEVNQWSPILFNRRAGGPGSVIGIVWLIPIFGVYFALRLAKAGRGPASRGRAIGFTLAGFALVIACFRVIPALASEIVVRLVLFNLAMAAAAAVAFLGWPELGRVHVAYGLAARIPVAIVMYFAMAGDWGTHYELGPPGFPAMDLMPKWLTIGLMPQLVLWIGITVLVGALFGGVALLFQRPVRQPA